jgi:hypothetical protein
MTHHNMYGTRDYIEVAPTLVAGKMRETVYENLVAALIYPQRRLGPLSSAVVALIIIFVVFVAIIALILSIAVGVWGGQRLGVW